MEHSYSRDCRPIEGSNGLKTRTLMVHRPPQCPSCHSHPQDESCDLDEANHPPFPSYNELIAKESMTECTRIANSVRNLNSDDVNWENCVNKTGWSSAQTIFFTKVAKILDHDHLSRLATMGKQHEPIQKRVIIDKSVQRMRKILSGISWDSRLTQWLHSVLMESLPPLYMASYLDILQTLKSKLPSLMDKMLFGKPMNINQDLLTPVMKKQWDPVLVAKTRKLPSYSVIVVIPSSPTTGSVPSRMQKWYQLFATIAQIVQINVPGNSVNKQPIEQITENVVQLARIKIQDLRNEQPTRHIILIGFNAGAAIALQVAMSENINSVICMGFAYNTVNGTRGAPDDHILDITIPIMFVVGQNSARTSQEEIESLREKMQSETSLVIVGSADDVLRVPKNKRQIESVTQSMVDSMITDEIYEFIKNCISNPPGPRVPTAITGTQIQQSNLSQARKITSQNILSNSGGNSAVIRKRKISQDNADSDITPIKKSYNKGTLMGRPRTRPLTVPVKQQQQQQHYNQPANETLSMAIQSILPSDKSKTLNDTLEDGSEILGTYEIITSNTPSTTPTKQQLTTIPQVTTISNSSPILQRTPLNPNTPKIKMITPQQFVQIKRPLQSQSKIYTIKTSSMMASKNTNSNANNNDGINSSTQGQIYTVKTTPSGGTQYVPAPASISNQLVLSPQKFTVLKSGTTNIIGDHKLAIESTTSDLSSTNIFDMPIIFADSDGNIHDSSSTSTAATSAVQTSVSSGNNSLTTTPNQIIIKTNKEQTSSSSPSSGTLLLNTNALNKSKTGKVVFINRNTMKPCPNIISKSAVPSMKYTKVVVTNPKTSQPSLVTRATSSSEQNLIISDTSGIGSDGNNKQVTSKSWTYTIQKQQQTPPQSTQQQPSIVKTTPTSGILNVSLPSSSKSQQYQPIILNIDSDKTTVKNMIKVDTSQMTKTFVLKQGGLVKPLPIFKSSQLNKNLTVKKVNFIQTKPSGVSVSNQASPQQQVGTTVTTVTIPTITVKPLQTTVTTSSSSSDSIKNSSK